jgi:hypothetical protein
MARERTLPMPKVANVHRFKLRKFKRDSSTGTCCAECRYCLRDSVSGCGYAFGPLFWTTEPTDLDRQACRGFERYQSQSGID